MVSNNKGYQSCAGKQEVDLIEKWGFVHSHVVNVNPLQSPYEKDGPPEWIHLGMNDVRKLHPQYHVDHAEPEGGSDSTGVASPNVSGAVQLHHCPGVDVEEVKENLSNEKLGLVDRFEVGQVSASINLHQA